MFCFIECKEGGMVEDGTLCCSTEALSPLKLVLARAWTTDLSLCGNALSLTERLLLVAQYQLLQDIEIVAHW